MGRFDFLKRKKEKKPEAEAKYVLCRKGEKGGFEKVMDLPRMMTAEELYPALSAGVYVIHKYEKGSTGFTESSQAFEVIGDETETTEPSAKLKSPFAGLREYAESMKAAQDDLRETFTILGPIAGFKPVGETKERNLVDEMKELRKIKDDLETLFPSSTTKSETIPIDGKIPAWLVYAPQALENSLDMIGKRLEQWGIVGSPTGKEGVGEPMIRLPDKPKVQSQRRETKNDGDETGGDSLLKLPDRPKVGEKKADVEKKKEGEKDGGKGTS